MIRQILILPIKAYKKYISPLLGPRCRYWPTCSDYMIQAITIHGAAKGLVLGTWRILRCNPWSKGGFDPVPPKGAWKNNKTAFSDQNAPEEK